MEKRTFIAINLPSEIKEELISWQKKLKKLNVRWTKPDNFHFTLAFIGYISEKELEKTFDISQKTALKFSPFLIELSRICLGPTPQRARMIWVEGKISRILKDLDKELKISLLKGKVTFDNKYPLKPHLTLARTKGNELKGLKLDQKINLSFKVGSIDVMESKLLKTGSEYKILKKCFLKA